MVALERLRTRAAQEKTCLETLRSHAAVLCERLPFFASCALDLILTGSLNPRDPVTLPSLLSRKHVIIF